VIQSFEMKLNSALEKEDTEPFGTILCKNIKFKNRLMRICAHFCRDRRLIIINN